jgi:hypothetical protein
VYALRSDEKIVDIEAVDEPMRSVIVLVGKQLRARGLNPAFAPVALES